MVGGVEFDLEAFEQDGQQLGSVTFVVPEAGGLASVLAGLASAAALARRRRRNPSPTR
jgi:hypothetical protein